MDKEKQIEEIEKMAYSICAMDTVSEYITNCDKCGYYNDCLRLAFAKRFYEASYRKADEVIDEFIERLKEENEISLRRYGKGIGMTGIFRIAHEMKFELFKQRGNNNGQEN